MTVTSDPPAGAASTTVPHSRRAAYGLAFVSLALVSIVAAGSYFAYDCIGPLAPILKRELALSSKQIGWLYSVYSIPVIALVVAGGLLADRLGVRRAGILFTALFFAGTVLTALGEFWLMVVGRLLFGIGAECLYVVMNKIVAKWFRDKTLALAFGLNLFLCRAGTYLAFFGLPWMVEALSSWQLTLWVVVAICGVSLLAIAIYALVDRHGERRGLTAIEERGELFRLRDALRLPRAFWVISMLCVLYYSAIFPFTAFATDFFQERYGLLHEPASRLTGVVILISMCTTWLFGALVDRIGRRATLMIVGSLLMIPCHVVMGYTEVHPWVPMVVLGVSFSLVPAAMWPALPLMVRSEQLGTAYGVISMVQNVGLFAFPLAAGAIRDFTGSYNEVMILFLGLSIAGLGFAFWLKRVERSAGSYLERPAARA